MGDSKGFNEDSESIIPIWFRTGYMLVPGRVKYLGGIWEETAVDLYQNSESWESTKPEKSEFRTAISSSEMKMR